MALILFHREFRRTLLFSFGHMWRVIIMPSVHWMLSGVFAAYVMQSSCTSVSAGDYVE